MLLHRSEFQGFIYVLVWCFNLDASSKMTGFQSKLASHFHRWIHVKPSTHIDVALHCLCHRDTGPFCGSYIFDDGWPTRITLNSLHAMSFWDLLHSSEHTTVSPIPCILHTSWLTPNSASIISVLFPQDVGPPAVAMLSANTIQLVWVFRYASLSTEWLPIDINGVSFTVGPLLHHIQVRQMPR